MVWWWGFPGICIVLTTLKFAEVPRWWTCSFHSPIAPFVQRDTPRTISHPCPHTWALESVLTITMCLILPTHGMRA